MVLTAELLAKGCVKAKHFHGSRKTEQCHGKVFSTSHILVNSIKSPPPLKVNIFKYHEVKAFCDPQRRKYSLWEHKGSELLISVSEAVLLPARQSLDKPNLREMWQKKKKEPTLHTQQGNSEDHPQMENQGCQDALK